MDIIGLIQPPWVRDVFGQQSNQIRWKMQNKGYYAIQGHRGQYQSKARMQLPISD